MESTRRAATVTATATLVAVALGGPVVIGGAILQLRGSSGISLDGSGGASTAPGWAVLVLVVVAAVMWLLMVMAVLHEIQRRDLPPKRWRLAPLALQRWAALTVERSVLGAGDLVGWTSTRVEADLSALVIPTPQSGLVIEPEPEPELEPEPEPEVEDQNMALRTLVAPSLIESLEPFEGPTFDHVVERGDSLWGLAERYLDDGTRWIEIVQANLGRRQGDGSLIDPGNDLLRGSVVAIPLTIDDTSIR